MIAIANNPSQVVTARILVVDDEPLIRDFVNNMLSRAGHTVTVAADGDAAMAALENAPFDIVITELVLPGKEGIEMIMDLRKRLPAVKVIAMSGDPRLGAENYLRIAGLLGAAKLAKPFTAGALLDIVDGMLSAGSGVPARFRTARTA